LGDRQHRESTQSKQSNKGAQNDRKTRPVNKKMGEAHFEAFVLVLAGDSVADVAVLAADLRSRRCVRKAFNNDSIVGIET
jgi:hypothetical protein